MTGVAALLHTLPSHVAQVVRGEWDVAAVASQAWDIADKVVGTVGGGRIGRGLIRRLKVRPYLADILHSAAPSHTHLQGSVCHIHIQQLSENKQLQAWSGMRRIAAEQGCTLVY